MRTSFLQNKFWNKIKTANLTLKRKCVNMHNAGFTESSLLLNLNYLICIQCHACIQCIYTAIHHVYANTVKKWGGMWLMRACSVFSFI